MAEIQQDIYLSLLPEISEYFQCSLEQRDHVDQTLLREFETKMIEIEGKFQIMGTPETNDALSIFSSLVRGSLESCTPADRELLHLAYVNLNYAMCCHIHSEKFKN